MKVASFLATLRQRDIHLWVDGESLRCSAPVGALTPDLRHQLQQRKKDILEFLRSAGELARQQRAIVPLRSGGKLTPIFGVAGHNGDVFCYRALAYHLGEEQPFFGLQPPGLDGQSEPLTRLEDLAAYFAKQMRAFQPHGPYVIAGYCAGGGIAFELARQLVQDGAEIELLALFGSPFPTWYRRVPQLQHRLKTELTRIVRHARKIASLPPWERCLYSADKLRTRKAHRAVASPAAPDPVLVQREKVAQATLAALRRYVPGHFPEGLGFFFPSKESFGFAPFLQWRSVVPRTQEYFGPDGCHVDNMLREPQASVFAELFRQRRSNSLSCELHTNSPTA